MGLTIKDGISTILAAVAGYMLYVEYVSAKVPFVNNYRIGSLVLLVVGIAGCAIGSRTVPGAGFNPVAILGGLAFVLAVVGIITGGKVVFELLAGVIILLWAVTTIKHAFLK